MSGILYPWETLAIVELDVSGIERDGQPVVLDQTHRDDRRISLVAEGDQTTWRRVRLDVAVRTSADTAGTSSIDRATLRVAVVVRCGRTDLRASALLSPSATDPTRWTGAISIDRTFVNGIVEMYAVAADGSDEESRFRGRSDFWTILVDDIETIRHGVRTDEVGGVQRPCCRDAGARSDRSQEP